MNRSDIEKYARKLPGVKELNCFQKTLLESTDRAVILTAPTGSGKTLAFASRLLMELTEPCSRVQAMIIAPSRELVRQIADVISTLAVGFKTVVLYGGHPMADEKRSLSPTPDIIVATPGRLLDHLQRGTLSLYGDMTLVLDEYDKSLELGFEDEMKRIVKRMGHLKCLLLSSATPLAEIPDYLPLKGARMIDAGDADKPRQRMDIVEVTSYSADKLDTFCDLLRSFPDGARSMVFVNHRESADRVFERLRKERIDSCLYSGALDQMQRDVAVTMLDNRSAAVMVTTDLGARGLDIAKLDNVIHYHLPTSEQAWTHRNGRTARIEANGCVYIIVSERESVPEYMHPDRKFVPPARTPLPIHAPMATLYFDAGKKEKLSKGDIAGFLSANTSVEAGMIGKIVVMDHYSLAAVPRFQARLLVEECAGKKVKGKRVRISLIKG